MSIEVRELLADAERAVRAGAWPDALAAFRDAGDHARHIGLRRAARRCYVRALEIDVLDTSVAERLAWPGYVAALPALRETWPALNARFAHMIADDTSTALVHPAIDGPIARVEIGTGDEIWLWRSHACAAMPDPMLLLLVRRTLWHAPRELPPEPMKPMMIHLDDDQDYRLFENADWEALPARSIRPALRVAYGGGERA